jgi:hypothetical protein
VTVCHKPGTPAEQTMTLPNAAVAGHLGHGDTLGACGQPPVVNCASGASDVCIDGDGVATATSGGTGAFEVTGGDALNSFPVTGLPPFSGLDGFDNDSSGSWTAGDDMHVEDPGAVDVAGSPVCPTAIRDTIHQLGQDCKVLDVDNSLTDGQPVTCDIEFFITFTQACDMRLKWRDTNGNDVWNSGEDIILDVNLNGVFD